MRDNRDTLEAGSVITLLGSATETVEAKGTYATDDSGSQDHVCAASEAITLDGNLTGSVRS